MGVGNGVSWNNHCLNWERDYVQGCWCTRISRTRTVTLLFLPVKKQPEKNNGRINRGYIIFVCMMMAG